MIRLAILGAGPSALVAAHAAMMYGDTEVTLFAPGEKSTIWGAQYLHQPIPGVSHADPSVIRYQMEGKPQDYLKKVYNGLWDGHISDDLRDQAHCAWDLREAYDKLWDTFIPHIQHFRLTENVLITAGYVQQFMDNFDMVVNTIPRKVFCMKPRQHEFRFTEIWAMGDSDRQRVPVPTREGIIVYNGHDDATWYRASRVFGYSTLEWPHHINRPPISGIARVRKPINHNCDCAPGVKHLGRMGRWDKNVLIHHVYADMTELLMIHEEDK